MKRSLARAASCLLLSMVVIGVGAEPARAAGPDYVDFHGHGWGHGRGMGQYGARGYADTFGWTSQQILDHFYGNTTAGKVDPKQEMRILLCDMEGVLICGSGAGLGSILVTSGTAFRVEGQEIAAGQGVRLRRLADRFELLQAPGGCAASGPWAPVGGGTSLDSNMDIDPLVTSPSGLSQMLRVCTPKSRYYRGSLDYGVQGGLTRLVNAVALDDYLRGVVPAEMPASWNPAAVQAQAVSARSYALADGRFEPHADTCDTTQCQVYQGATSEASGSDAAIAATAGVVRIRNGKVISTEFSSSTGGWTAGGTFPAVVDQGDGVSNNPNHDWTVRISDDTIEAKYPQIGDLQSIEVTSRNGLGEDGGRVLQVRIVGSSGVASVSGDGLRLALGLKSDWFTPMLPAPPKALTWTLRATPDPGQPTSVVRYGGPSDRAISCDWDGDGDDTLGVYSAGTWFLRDDLSPGPPQRAFQFGTATYTPVCGDWDGDGTDTIGVYTSGGWWHLRNDVGPGPPEISFQYGYSRASPVVGDWDGDGTDGIGVYDGGSWMLRDTASPGPPQRWFSYGYGAASPVVGDWDGDHFDGIGVYDRGAWMLRETATPGQPVRWFSYGYPGPAPVTGRWSSAADGIGILTVG